MVTYIGTFQGTTHKLPISHKLVKNADTRKLLTGAWNIQGKNISRCVHIVVYTDCSSKIKYTLSGRI